MRKTRIVIATLIGAFLTLLVLAGGAAAATAVEYAVMAAL
jgi:hypothetical protein